MIVGDELHAFYLGTACLPAVAAAAADPLCRGDQIGEMM